MTEDVSLLECIAEYAEEQKWTTEWIRDNALRFDRKGHWCSYIFVAQELEDGVFVLACQMGLEVGELSVKKQLSLYELINQIHVVHSFGRLTYEVDAQLIIWSYRMFLGEEYDWEVVERTLEQAFSEIELFYPSFQLMLAKKAISVEEAFFKAIPTLHGRA